LKNDIDCLALGVVDNSVFFSEQLAFTKVEPILSSNSVLFADFGMSSCFSPQEAEEVCLESWSS